MNKTGSAAKVKLNSFDDLFGDGQPQAGIEQVQEIALSELHEFKGHPFKVLDDEKMQETVESVGEHGVLMPGIARPRAEGGYEIIAGHRRRHACELVGLDTMPIPRNFGIAGSIGVLALDAVIGGMIGVIVLAIKIIAIIREVINIIMELAGKRISC